MSAPQGSWWIVCDGHTVGPIRSQESADRRLAEIEQLGACHAPHRIERRGDQ